MVEKALLAQVLGKELSVDEQVSTALQKRDPGPDLWVIVWRHGRPARLPRISQIHGESELDKHTRHKGIVLALDAAVDKSDILSEDDKICLRSEYLGMVAVYDELIAEARAYIAQVARYQQEARELERKAAQ